MSTNSHNLSISISLPKIYFKRQQKNTQKLCQLRELEDQNHTRLLTHEEEQQEIHKLDQWSNSLPTVKRKRNKTSQSIVFLYKSNNKYSPVSNLASVSKFKQSSNGDLGSASLFLAQMDNELAKIEKINYFAIHQNVQYCAGVYQIAFEALFKKLEQFRGSLAKMLSCRLKQIEQFRERKLEQIKTKRTINNIKSSNHNLISSLAVNKQNIQGQMKQKIQKSSSFTARQQNQASQQISQKVRNYLELKQAIQYRYQSLKPLKRVLQKIQKERVKLLNFSLQLGYDVREEGLTWILKELNNDNNKLSSDSQKADESVNNKLAQPRQAERQSYRQGQKQKQKQKQMQQKWIPKATQFPNFLTEQQINFIVSKYRNDFKLQTISSEIEQKEQIEQTVLQTAFENVRRDRNRKLSMIKERELMEKLLLQRKEEVATGHKYMNHDVLKIMQNNQQIKATTNELIYQETLRKLNRFCSQEIHGKRPKNEQTGRDRQASTSEQVSRFMHEIKRMLSDTSKLKGKQEQIKSEEDKELADIIMKLRHEIYEGRFVSEKRNPISVICCLVGWKKAKKILENQMSISMPSAIEQSH